MNKITKPFSHAYKNIRNQMYVADPAAPMRGAMRGIKARGGCVDGIFHCADLMHFKRHNH
jgi:hypothetical protein